MKKILQVLLVLISLSTIGAGLVQLIAPAFVLHIIDAAVTPTTRHFFGIVGMFMVLFGGLMLVTIYQAIPDRNAVIWCALQKLGASAAVILGIFHGIFGLPAAGVAAFDGLSGLLFLYYFWSLKKNETT